MSFDLRSIAVYIFGLFLLLMSIKLFRKPLIWIFRLMLSCVIGVGVLLVFNLVFGRAGLMISLNPFNALTVGVLGAPGLVLLCVLSVLA